MTNIYDNCELTNRLYQISQHLANRSSDQLFVLLGQLATDDNMAIPHCFLKLIERLARREFITEKADALFDLSTA